MPSVLLTNGMSKAGDERGHGDLGEDGRPATRAGPSRGRSTGTAARGRRRRSPGAPPTRRRTSTTTPTVRSRWRWRSRRRRRSASRNAEQLVERRTGWRARDTTSTTTAPTATAIGSTAVRFGGPPAGAVTAAVWCGPRPAVEVAHDRAHPYGSPYQPAGGPSAGCQRRCATGRDSGAAARSTTRAQRTAGRRRVRRRATMGAMPRPARCGRRRCPPTSWFAARPLDGRRRRRRGDRRRRLHRAVDGLLPRRGRPGAAHRRASSAEHVGFGASGRNGGWCSALLPTGLAPLAARHGRDAAIAMQRAMHATVDEVGKVRRRRGRRRRLRQGRHDLRSPARRPSSRGWPPRSTRPGRSASATTTCAGSTTAELGRAVPRRPTRAAALFTPHCAAVHPLRLAHAVAGAAVRRGVAHPRARTARDAIEPRRVTTAGGTVRADVVVLATEAYTVRLRRSPPRRRSRCTR